MKKLVTVFILVLFSLTLFAQGHLTFKNIPIQGNISSFISKMKSAGFSFVEQNDKNCIMNGPFAGFSNCDIVIGFSPKTKTVWKVMAILPSQISWGSVLFRYLEYKQRFIDKYGKAESFEFFEDPFYEGDGYELMAFRNEKATYASYWTTPLGIIQVAISASSNSHGWVTLGYEDKSGVAILDAERSAIINYDL